MPAGTLALRMSLGKEAAIAVEEAAIADEEAAIADEEAVTNQEASGQVQLEADLNLEAGREYEANGLHQRTHSSQSQVSR